MAVLCAFTIPFSTPLVSIAGGLALFLWLLSGSYKAKLGLVAASPVSLAALMLFSLFVVGLLYSTAELGVAIGMLKKYHKLLFIPLLVSLLDEDVWRRRALIAFMLAMGIVLLGSYLQYFGLLPLGPPDQEYTPFKGRIAHNFFMAFGIYILAELFLSLRRWRWLWSFFLVLALYNLFFMVNGRTGQVVFFVLALLFAVQHFHWRGFIVGFVLSVLFGALVFQLSPDFRLRMQQGMTNTLNYLQTGEESWTGAGLRLSWAVNSFRLAQERPVTGFGTGSFQQEYKRYAEARGLFPTGNPHNEYANIGVQLGAVGLGVFLFLLALQWRESGRKSPLYRHIGQALVAAIAVGCMLNSFLMDHGEGMFYAILSGVVFAGADQRYRGIACH